jgi:recombination protein RecA
MGARQPLPEGRTPLWDTWSAGQLLELSGSAPGKLSTVVGLVVHAQAEGEPCAWVSPREEASFYPPDFAQAGVDLGALAVVRVPFAAGSHGVVRASELLLRSGAFGLVVIDFSHGVPKGELAWQSRLSGLVRMHDARAVLLTPSQAAEPSLGPMVSLRVEPAWQAERSTRVLLSQRVLKSKLSGAAAVSPDVREAPQGAVRFV